MTNRRRLLLLSALALSLVRRATGQDAMMVRIDPSHALKPVSRYLTGACIEDVNHEIYGGLYSQMIFGESFQEPPTRQIADFVAYGGQWNARDGIVSAAASNGAKLVHGTLNLPTEAVGVDVLFPDERAGNAGLIVDVKNPAVGADRFAGYEISLDPATKTVRLARHRQNYRLLREAPCNIATNRWISLAVMQHDQTLEITVDGKSVLQYQSADGSTGGDIGLRTWQRAANFRNLWTSNGEQKRPLVFASSDDGSISGMWRLVRRGSAAGTATWIADQPFVGTNSQRISMTSGSGEIAVENRGLNRQGLGLVANKPYQSHLWARAATPTKVRVSFTSTDGAHVYANQDLSIMDADWRRYDFTLTPDTTDTAGGFDIALIAPGSVDLGYVFLEPGPWGTFKGLPIRNDVAQALIDEGVSGLRYGGSMVNAPEYRWKKMVGDRDRRPPYHGTWYDSSSNGWGILDFLNFCEAARFLPIPDFNIDETPNDMADFIEYVNGPADSAWGARRVADGHPAPYGLTHMELGNEERVDDTYFKRFEAIARAIWTKDPHMILTVGDFAYNQPILDAMQMEGAASRITNLSAHKKILELARQFDAEVWFDIHLSTDGLARNGRPDPFPTYIDAIDQLAGGAKHHVVVFELNANNHFQRRALANAQVLLQIEQDGRLPFISSANGLQVDKQNDNGWDQGLLFLNSAHVWLQPPGYALRMFSQNYQPILVECAVTGKSELAAVATASDDRGTVVLQTLNPSDKAATSAIQLAGWDLGHATISVQTLAADLNVANTAENPETVRPTVQPALSNEAAPINQHTFPPRSFTVIRWSRVNSAH